MSELTLLGLGSDSENQTAALGRLGEELAAAFLIRRGYRLVCSNFKVPVGRNRRGAAVTGEIDIVAIDGETLCFVEVKTRRSDGFASPLAAIDARKRRQVARAANVYRRVFGVRNRPYRFDAVTVVVGDGKPVIELHKKFW